MNIALLYASFRKCELCGFLGIPYKRMLPIDNSKVTLKPASSDGNEIELKKAHICLTCFETPMGVLSDNQTHKRLDQREYEQK